MDCARRDRIPASVTRQGRSDSRAASDSPGRNNAPSVDRDQSTRTARGRPEYLLWRQRRVVENCLANSLALLFTPIRKPVKARPPRALADPVELQRTHQWDHRL